MVADDFGSLYSSAVNSSAATSSDGQSKEKGEKRTYLRCYETAPPQWLNAYGPAKYQKLSDNAVWTAMSEPLKTGAVWMSELCSKEVERRGVGMNRALHPLKLFMEYNTDATIKGQNERLLKPEIYKELYQEIDTILPSVTYCLAPKKEAPKKGGSILRGAQTSQVGMAAKKSDEELDRHAKVVYEFMSLQKPSRIRMMLGWQGSGGMAYVASVHHRVLQCFRYCGNSLHDINKVEVSLEEFQECIKSRHRLGCSGIDEEPKPDVSGDFH